MLCSCLRWETGGILSGLLSSGAHWSSLGQSPPSGTPGRSANATLLPAAGEKTGNPQGTFETRKGADHSLGTLLHRPRRQPCPPNRGFGVPQNLIPSSLSQSFPYPEAPSLSTQLSGQNLEYSLRSPLPLTPTSSLQQTLWTPPHPLQRTSPTCEMPGCVSLPWTAF